ncbi:hypothetical protein [Leifsonia sp. RAF41]|uniref:hypothetical protein n=1 Tax=Leifsonia sp. RAF41 TaxID=3233056 RepID=UPI003F996456
MRRIAALALSIALVTTGCAIATPRSAAAQPGLQPHTGVHSCPDDTTRIGTYSETDLEAEYNEDLVLCDWGPQEPGHFQFTFTNESPVVWAFKDRIQTAYVPENNSIYHEPTGIAPLFSTFAIEAGIAGNDWIVAPGERVSIASLDTLAWGVATPLITSSWLLYKQQADTIVKLGKQYAKRIATTGYASRTRTFLWNCTEAGVTTRNALRVDSNDDAVDVAASWLSTAKTDSACVKSFSDLFAKKSSKLPPATYSIKKWFNTGGISEASAFVGEIMTSREWIRDLTGLVRSFRP